MYGIRNNFITFLAFLPDQRSGLPARCIVKPKERLQILLKTIESLREINLSVPVIVEGKRDLKSLRLLGLRGKIIQVHRGQSLYEFSESVLERYPSFVLLIDWDQKGQDLYMRLGQLLAGHYEEFDFIREQLISVSEEEIQEVEALPSLIEKLSRAV